MNNGKFSRRAFLRAGGAFALLNGGCAFRAPTGFFGGGGANVSFGVMSDVHIQRPGDEGHLLNALRFFRERGVDGVMVAGDIADQGRISQLKIFADAWYAVFPDDKGLDGKKVEKLFIYGNHDIWGFSWGTKDDPELAKREGIGYEGNPAKVWEELFHEPYSEFSTKRSWIRRSRFSTRSMPTRRTLATARGRGATTMVRPRRRCRASQTPSRSLATATTRSPTTGASGRARSLR